MQRTVRFPRACKRVTPSPSSNIFTKRNPKNIRKNREAVMANVLKDGSKNARLPKKLPFKESNPAGTEAVSTELTDAGPEGGTVVTTDHEAVTTTFNISPPTISPSSSTSSHSVCHTTMVHAEPLAAETSCRSNVPHTKGINGMRKSNHYHIANPMKPPVKDFGAQTELKITDRDIMFLNNLKAKRMDISQINAIVKNNDYIVSYIEPQEKYRRDYYKRQNGELPSHGLTEWQYNQTQLEALAFYLEMKLNSNRNDGADIKEEHLPGHTSPISDDSE